MTKLHKKKKSKKADSLVKAESCSSCIFFEPGTLPEMDFCSRQGEYLRTLIRKRVLTADNITCKKFVTKPQPTLNGKCEDCTYFYKSSDFKRPNCTHVPVTANEKKNKGVIPIGMICCSYFVEKRQPAQKNEDF